MRIAFRRVELSSSLLQTFAARYSSDAARAALVVHAHSDAPTSNANHFWPHGVISMLALVTATRNSIETLHGTLDSLLPFSDQIRSVFVDGGSNDGTVEALQAHVRQRPESILIDQSSKGLYQAINEGVMLAARDPAVTHIGMLHSDDRLLPAAFARYADWIASDPARVFCSDIQFHNKEDRVVRTWKSGQFSRLRLRTGWMPPHTSVIVRKEIYQDVGLYDASFGTAADYQWLVRVLTRYGSELSYFPERTLSMLVGGASSAGLKARLKANAMDGRVWRDASIFQAATIRVFKPLRKVGQFVFPS